MKVYHGTQIEYIDEILESGLSPRRDLYGQEGIWFSPTIELALAAGPIVLEVNIPKNQVEKRRMYFEGEGFIGPIEYISRVPIPPSRLRIVRSEDLNNWIEIYAGKLPE